MPAEGGEPKLLITKEGILPLEAPDGKTIYFLLRHGAEIWSVPAQGETMITAQQGELWPREYQAHANRSHDGHAMQRLNRSFFVAQTRKDQGLLERPCRYIRCQTFRFLPPPDARVCISKVGAIVRFVAFPENRIASSVFP